MALSAWVNGGVGLITEEIVNAIDMMAEMCSNEAQAAAMRSVREMLCDFDAALWSRIDSPAEAYDWLEQFLPCKRKEGV